MISGEHGRLLDTQMWDWHKQTKNTLKDIRRRWSPARHQDVTRIQEYIMNDHPVIMRTYTRPACESGVINDDKCEYIRNWQQKNGAKNTDSTLM